MGDEILTLEELSRYLKVNKATMYRLAQAGKIPAHKVGKVWRFQKAEIDHWLRLSSNAAQSAIQSSQERFVTEVSRVA